MKYENLKKEEKEILDRFAKENPELVAICKGIDDFGCWKCGHKPKNLGEFEFHLFSVHGIPREIFEMQMMSSLKSKDPKFIHNFSSMFIDLVESQ